MSRYILQVLFCSFMIISGCSYDESKQDIVFITATGAKYHDNGCVYLGKSSISISRTDARKRGYEPCSKCIAGPSPAMPELEKEWPAPAATHVEEINISSARCMGITSKGKRCKRRVKDRSGKCHQHR